MLQKQFTQWASTVRDKANLQARFVLWDGQHFDLGKFITPQVTVYIKELAAISYFISPSVDKLGEAYVKGKIDFEGKLSDMINVAFALARSTVSKSNNLTRITKYLAHSKQADLKSIQFHYDLSNEFYQQWLDRNMVYSCAYFENGDEDLETAQLKKIDHILTKIQVRPDDTLLDIGCGWGALVLRAAEKFGARCVGITLSQKQYELANARVEAAGLGDRIEIRLQDYRDVTTQFDRITSVGMFEHVGRKHLVKYFKQIHDLLKEDGIAMNHGITATDPNDGDTNYGGGVFLDKYVFPDGELTHIGCALHDMQEGGLEITDVENLRRHYARTLNIWVDNFEKNSASITPLIDAEHYRIWRLYLAGCAYAFQQDQISIYQVVCRRAGRSADTLPWSRRYIYD